MENTVTINVKEYEELKKCEELMREDYKIYHVDSWGYYYTIEGVEDKLFRSLKAELKKEKENY